MTRQRMYVFERAYVDYGKRFIHYWRSLWQICRRTWQWFWSGLGAKIFDILLNLTIAGGAITAGFFFVRYEINRGAGIGFGTIMIVLVLLLVTGIILWGWKAPVHFLARVVSGATAAGVILVLSLTGLTVLLVGFLVYLLFLVILTSLSFLLFIPMRAAHKVWRIQRQIRYRCPYDQCGASAMPIHICSCGTQYTDLKPSFYGIFHHTCRHPNGENVKLPTMDFRGRNKLTRLCGACERPLIMSAIGELAEKPIAIIGGPTVGKTIFMRQSIRDLVNLLKSYRKAVVNIDAEEHQLLLQQDLAALDNGLVVGKTSGDIMQAIGVAVRIPKLMRSLLYIFDAPGEDFETMSRFGLKQVTQHLHAIILMVDPFSIEALAEDAAKMSPELRPSDRAFHEVVSVLIAGVNQMLVRQPTDVCKIPLAVVLNKEDALPIDDFPFLSDLIQDNHLSVEQRSISCRKALEKLGEGNSIRALEQKFSNVRYFSCSALGRMPDENDNRPFIARGVLDPYLWLLNIERAIS